MSFIYRFFLSFLLFRFLGVITSKLMTRWAYSKEYKERKVMLRVFGQCFPISFSYNFSLILWLRQKAKVWMNIFIFRTNVTVKTIAIASQLASNWLKFLVEQKLISIESESFTYDHYVSLPFGEYYVSFK